MYEIRQAVLQDWPAIEEFIGQTYGANAKYKGEKRWLWQLKNTPYQNSTDDAISSWIALHEGKVVGQISYQLSRIWFGEREESAGWVVDVMVHPDHRGNGLGHKIHAAINSNGRILVTLTMAAATRRIAERSGCITLGNVTHFVRVQRLAPKTTNTLLLQRAQVRPKLKNLVHAFVNSRIGPLVISKIAGAFFRVRNMFFAAARIQSDVVEVDRFPESDIDAITAVMRSKLPAMFDRSVSFCKWRFDCAPDLVYRKAMRVCNGRTIGLVYWRLPEPCELQVGTIVDILADPDDFHTIAALTSHAVARMMESCDAIVAGASTPAFIRAFRRHGFFAIRKHRPTIVCLSPDTMSRLAQFRDHWHMSKADHDWDQIHAVDG